MRLFITSFGTPEPLFDEDFFELLDKALAERDKTESTPKTEPSDPVRKSTDAPVEVTAERLTDWKLVYDLALATAGVESSKEPSDQWKGRILVAEHSPIRALMFKVTMKNIPYWVSVHLVRHKIGVEHFVTTQREDRTKDHTPRSKLPQDALVNHTMVINAQALITISRKRLCGKASKETRDVWFKVREAIRKVDQAVADSMLPECLYRGACPEMSPCKMSRRDIQKSVGLLPDDMPGVESSS